jgi:hypothetical protein
MRILLRAAMAAISIGSIGSAYADPSGRQAGGYAFPDYVVPGSVYAGSETPAPRPAAQNGSAIHTFVAHSRSQGISLFPADLIGGGS